MQGNEKTWGYIQATIVGMLFLCGCNDGGNDQGSDLHGSKKFTGILRTFKIHGPLVQNPQILQADEANVEDSTSVVGVSVKGHHRAYRTRGMSMLETHVVNDLIQSIPVTVTYCDLRNCARVFTAGIESMVPLNVRVGGFDDRDGLLLDVEGELFAQISDRPPLEHLDAIRTTWKDWKTTYPDTDIYLGRDADPEALNNELKNLVVNIRALSRPKVESATMARIGDESKVIGVAVKGTYRAYRTNGLSDPQRAVLNDTIAGIPVTVTYNHWTGCIRVFTKQDSAKEPLTVGLRGWVNGAMMLQFEDQVIAQDSLNLDQLKFETMSWGSWKSAHPQTDVFTGIGLASESDAN